MARSKSAVTKSRRHRKTLKQAKGYFGHKSIGYKSAKEQVRKSQEYAFRDRKQIKREMRKLWIKRINIACRMYGMSYSQFMNGLKKANIEINRKMLADIALNNTKQFKDLVDESQKALKDSLNAPKQIESKKEKTPTKKVVAKPQPKTISKPIVKKEVKKPVVKKEAVKPTEKITVKPKVSPT